MRRRAFITEHADAVLFLSTPLYTAGPRGLGIKPE